MSAATRAEHRAALLAVVDRWQDHGLRIPCREHPAPWTSDDTDAQDRAAAACDGCPALDPCHAYGAAWPREAGVYGGRTERDRAPRPRRREPAA